MAVADTSREPTATTMTGRPLSELQIPKKLWRDRGKSTTTSTSPERTRVWTEPTPKPKRVPVVYYLSRNGHLEHPHFMEVPLSSPDGLYLRDVIRRLNLLRGTSMAALYSWSSKRSYKNGFVWQDLTERDFIYPSHGNEYVLKGSEILHDAPPPLSSSSSTSRPLESVSFRSPKLTESRCDEEANFPVVVPRRRNQSWSSIDLHEYKVYKTESAGESARRPAMDASTQTHDRRRRARRQVKEEQKVTCEEPGKREGQTTELTRDEISPPPSDSSPETLETLMNADGRLVLSSSTNNNATGDRSDQTAESLPRGKMRASAVLMQLITCGSFSFRNCGASYVKDQGLALIGPHNPTLLRGAGNNNNASNSSSCNPSVVGTSGEIASLSIVKPEDKEFFSGSLIETANKKAELVPALKRSSSYNADGSQMQLGEKDLEAADDGVRARCIPRKLRMQPTTRKVEHEQEERQAIVVSTTQHQQEGTTTTSDQKVQTRSS
ncbi:protein UPSTREAM OF FLC isoform X2 [Punica granatum]|uniref:Protein UPSTREAM OF FLC isoform X2 n=1 Tax=Punica granatum TaxID=22663 RepID=A0A6P8CSJ5_PUNGR|nr:protein UPSTREAM OF FLC isoform X2 [Punica granatum]